MEKKPFENGKRRRKSRPETDGESFQMNRKPKKKTIIHPFIPTILPQFLTHASTCLAQDCI